MANIGTQAIAELVLRIKAENLAGAALGSLAGNIRALPLVAAGAAAGVAGATIKMASDYQSMLTSVANNTTMGTNGVKAMDAAIRQTSRKTGAAPEALAQGYMHIMNMGFGAADATLIMDAATKSAISTHGDAAATMNLLANVMHEYGMSGQQAAQAMDVLHMAGAQGNMTLEQMVEAGGPAIAMAANLHVPLTQVAAAMAALTRHGATAGEASTYLKGILEHIVNPTKQARDELTALSAKTGIDLLADFSPMGLQTKGLTGVLADLRAAHIDAAQLFKAVPAIRGGIGAQILTGTGATDYGQVLESLDEVMAGKIQPTAEAWARTQGTLGFQMTQLAQSTGWLGRDIGTSLLPAMTNLVTALVPIVQGLDDWVNHHQRLIATATPIFIVLSTIAGLALVAGPAVAFLAAAFSPLSLAIMGLVAVIGLLSVAWATNWGGIQQKVAAAWAYIQPALKQMGQAIGAIGGAFKTGGLSGAANALMTQAGTLLGHLLSWVTGTALPALSVAVGRWATAFWSWVQRVAPPIMATLGVLLGRLVAWAAGTALPAIAGAVASWAGALWGWVGRATPPLLGALGALLGRLGAWMGGTALPAIGAQLGRWAIAFWQWVGPATASLISHLGPLLDRLGNWIGTTALPAIGAKLTQWGTAFWHWIVVALPLMEEKLGEFLGQMIVWIPTASVALSLKLLEWGAAFIGWLLPRWLDLLGKLNTFLGNIGTWILTKALPALLKLGQDMGTQLIAGVVKGISNAAAHVHDAIQNALHGKTTPSGMHFTWGPSPGAAHHPAPGGALHQIAGAVGPRPLEQVVAAHRPQERVPRLGAGNAAATLDFAAALAAFTHQKGLDPADVTRMRADIALAAKTSAQQAKHLQALLDVAVKHNHDAIRHQGALAEMHRRQHHGGGGTGSGGGGLSSGTEDAINRLTGNAPKHQTPAQIAASDFSAALTYFRAEKGLDPALVTRMQADIAIIARSNPGRAKDLEATLKTVRGRREDAIRHAGAVAAHHAQVLAQRARVGTVHDDVNRFKTDLLTLGTSAKDHARLVADYLRIQKDENTAHYRGTQVALDLAENMRKVAAHFKGLAARAVEPYKQAAFDLARGAGYGQTTVTMGPVRDQLIAQLQAQLRELKAQNAGQQKTIAALEAQLVELHRASGLLDGIFHNTAGTHEAAQQTARHTQPRPTGGAHGFSQRTGMPVPV